MFCTSYLKFKFTLKYDDVLKNVVQITASLKKGSTPFEFEFRSDTSDKILY